MVKVTKWDGSREDFRMEKLARTLLRVGASEDVARDVASWIEGKIYDGISTRQVLDLALRRMKKYEPAVSFIKDLKTALCGMRSKPEFEEYVRIVLRAHGYKVTGNQVIQGFCATHEIDGIAEKEGETIYLEVKSHTNPHDYTPFDVTLAAKAKWDDLKEGFKRGLNSQPFDKVLIVCNTKLSEHARKYADCIGLEHVGWNSPPGRGLDTLVEERRLYPTTILKSLTDKERDVLSEHGIITLKQLAEAKGKTVGIPKPRMTGLLKEAESIIGLYAK
jgi:Holliday junction resolvase-like predicted endonuclease